MGQGDASLAYSGGRPAGLLLLHERGLEEETDERRNGDDEGQEEPCVPHHLLEVSQQRGADSSDCTNTPDNEKGPFERGG